jgi:hypothetical protein
VEKHNYSDRVVACYGRKLREEERGQERREEGRRGGTREKKATEPQ